MPSPDSERTANTGTAGEIAVGRADSENIYPVTILTATGTEETAKLLAEDLRRYLGDGVRVLVTAEDGPPASRRIDGLQPASLHLEIRHGNAPDQKPTARPETLIAATGSVVVDRTYFAPVVDLLDPRNSVEIPLEAWNDQRLEAASEPRVRIVELEEIRLPHKALAVSGLYPHDPEYPLLREVVLSWRIPQGGPPADRLEEWLRGRPSAPPPPAIYRVAAVGDMMLRRGIAKTLIRGEDGLERVFHDALPVLRDHDLTIGNLEGAVTTGGVAAVKSYTFRFPPESLPPLKEAGFDYVSLTNNHAFDFGMQGFLDTLSHLQEAGIGTSGAGADLEAVFRPWEADPDESAGMVPVRVFSLGAYPREKNGFDGLRMTAAAQDKPGVLWATDENVAELSRQFDPEAFDVVMVHGGTEWSRSPSAEQISLYRGLSDAGADLVVGSHPHVLQPVEAHRGGLIAYSLGNFLFAGMEGMPYAEESIILSVGVVDGRIVYVDFYPVELDGPSVDIARDGPILERFIRLSREFAPASSR